jgi:hypothetical protein
VQLLHCLAAFFCLLPLTKPALSANQSLMRLTDIPGCYGEQYQVEDIDDSTKTATAYQYLEISRDSASGVFSFRAGTTGGIGGRFHYCFADGGLEVADVDDTHVVLKLNMSAEQKKEQIFPDEPCLMKIIVTKERLEINEFDLACHENYLCGVGAHLNGFTVSRQQKSFSMCDR